MPYKRSGKTVYVKKGGKWKKKATAKYINLRYEILWEDSVEKIIEPLRKKLKEEYDARESHLVSRENK